MTPFTNLAGDVVHKVISRVQTLEQGCEISVDSAEDMAVQLFRNAWKESRRGDWERRPKKAAHPTTCVRKWLHHDLATTDLESYIPVRPNSGGWPLHV